MRSTPFPLERYLWCYYYPVDLLFFYEFVGDLLVTEKNGVSFPDKWGSHYGIKKLKRMVLTFLFTGRYSNLHFLVTSYGWHQTKPGGADVGEGKIKREVKVGSNSLKV